MKMDELKGFSLDYIQLQEYQPNRYPFLMIDYVEEVIPGKYARGYKNLSNNEWFFPIHFPGHPNMPGVLQIEAMSQMLTVAVTTIEGNKGKVAHGLEIDNVKFKKEVVPGDKLIIEASLLSYRRGIAKGSAVCYTNGEVCSSADFVICLPEVLEQYKPRRVQK